MLGHTVARLLGRKAQTIPSFCLMCVRFWFSGWGRNIRIQSPIAHMGLSGGSTFTVLGSPPCHARRCPPPPTHPPLCWVGRVAAWADAPPHTCTGAGASLTRGPARLRLIWAGAGSAQVSPLTDHPCPFPYPAAKLCAFGASPQTRIPLHQTCHQRSSWMPSMGVYLAWVCT